MKELVTSCSRHGFLGIELGTKAEVEAAARILAAACQAKHLGVDVSPPVQERLEQLELKFHTLARVATEHIAFVRIGSIDALTFYGSTGFAHDAIEEAYDLAETFVPDPDETHQQLLRRASELLRPGMPELADQLHRGAVALDCVGDLDLIARFFVEEMPAEHLDLLRRQ